jgi:hypothetical protein
VEHREGSSGRRSYPHFLRASRESERAREHRILSVDNFAISILILLSDKRIAVSIGVGHVAFEHEIDRLEHRAHELREELALLRERAPYQIIDERLRTRLAAKLAHVEKRAFEMRQMRLFRG